MADPRVGAGEAVRHRKLIHLEGARGLASIFVIFWHFSLAFSPFDLAVPVWEGGFGYSPLLVLINGPGAVSFFFTLSGFVLTLTTFRHPSARALILSAVKRLPRLIVPCAASMLIGYLLLTSGWNLHGRAGAAAHSGWLIDFGNGHPPAGRPTLVSVLRQSVLIFLLPNQSWLNSNLWTMREEFIGSLFVFAAAAPMLSGWVWRRPRLYGGLLALVALAWLIHHPAYGQFLAGALLAFVYARWSAWPKIGGGWAIGLLLVGLACFSTFEIKLHAIGALALITLLLGHGRTATMLSGRVGDWLGQLSFPIYLVHTLMILSVGSAVYLLVRGMGLSDGGARLSALAAVLASTFLAALPFVWLERRWVPLLNRIVRSAADRIVPQRKL